MAHLYSTHDLLAYAEYGLLTVRDQDCDAGIGANEAIDRARKNVAASTGYELFIHCAQDLFKIAADLEVWDGAPPANVATERWSDPLEFELHCPSGDIALGSPTGAAIGLSLPDGAGVYAIQVHHTGRDTATVRFQDYVRRLGTIPAEQSDREGQSAAGIERYLLRMWKNADLPDRDSDDTANEKGVPDSPALTEASPNTPDSRELHVGNPGNLYSPDAPRVLTQPAPALHTTIHMR